MGLLTRTLAAGIIATPAAFIGLTYQSHFVPVNAKEEPIFTSSFYKQHNPNNNDPTYDICVRRVPLSQIKPGLLADGKLTERFCAGVWSGAGISSPTSPQMRR